MRRVIRFVLFVVAIMQIALTVAFVAQVPAIVQLWPLPDTTPLSFIFIGSIFFAAAASTLWCLVVREEGALTGIGLDYIAIFLPTTLLSIQLASSSGSGAIGLFALACFLTLIPALVLTNWARRIPFRDTRPTPRLVRISFLVFVIALIIVGALLILKTPNILPWRVTEEFGVIAGWFFLGAAAYFVYGLMRPVWANAGGQLAGFLAYDVILILPFLQRLPTIAPELRTSLIIYLIVVVYSGLLSIYYLFLNPATRLFGRAAVPAAA